MPAAEKLYLWKSWIDSIKEPLVSCDQVAALFLSQGKVKRIIERSLILQSELQGSFDYVCGRYQRQVEVEQVSQAIGCLSLYDIPLSTAPPKNVGTLRNQVVRGNGCVESSMVAVEQPSGDGAINFWNEPLHYYSTLTN